VAEATRELLAGLGLRGFAKTSGNRGIHIYVRIEPRYDFEQVRHAAIGLGRELERRDVGATTSWWKEERPSDSIFLDFNQNLRDRTVAGAWSLRPRPGAPVSTPLTWEQLAEVRNPAEFNLFTVPVLLADGDPWAEIDDVAYPLDPLLDLWESLPGGELNFPPDHPKMPGEPPRVQPSKKVAEHWDADGNWIEK
jgi:DNA primase